jgi:RNA recognition motif-containing protein
MIDDEGNEIITFKTPTELSTLYVSNIPNDASNEALLGVFAPFGLLHEIYLFEHENSSHMSGYVRYYSVRTAKEAQRATHNMELLGRKLTVNFCKKRPSSDEQRQFDLPVSRAVQLANFYIGFNKWTSSIISMERLEFGKREDYLLFFCSYKCIVKFTLREDGRFVYGVGEGSAESADRGDVVDIAKKSALTKARKDAFSKTLIIVLASGKVIVHFSGTRLPFEEWDENTNTTPTTLPNKTNINVGNSKDADLN